MEEVKRKSKTQLLRELQDVVDKFNLKKEKVDSLLDEIDELGKEYHHLVNEIKK